MIEADDPRQLPRAILQLPKHDKFCLASCIGLWPVGVGKAMNANLDSALAFQRVNLKRPRNKLAMDLSADVVFHSVNQALPAQREPGLIVIELKVLNRH